MITLILRLSHVLPALISKFSDAKESGDFVTCWGDGSAMREFLHVDDLAETLVLLAMKDYNSPEPINVGTGEDVTIKQLAETIAKTIGYDDIINWDTSKT